MSILFRATMNRRLLHMAVCLLLLMVSAATPAAAQAACDSCVKGVRVGVQGVLFTSGFWGMPLHIDVDGHSTCTVINNGGNPCNDALVTNKGYFYMKPGRTYLVDAGIMLCLTNINFDVPPGYDLYIKTDSRYATNDVFHKTTTIRRTGMGYAGTGDGAWHIVLREKCPTCDGACAAGESMGAQTVSPHGVVWRVGLGELADGRSAENISILDDELDSYTYKPNALIYTPPANTNEVDVIRANDDGSIRSPNDPSYIVQEWNSPDGILRQVKTPETLADVVTINDSEFEVRFYRLADVGGKVSGLYTVSGQPFVTWKIKNPNPATTARLQISKTQNSTTDTDEFAWDETAGSWSLDRGAGSALTTRASITNPTDPYERTETVIATNNTAQIASKTASTYHFFPWGEELIQEIRDPDGAALTTTYAFYEDSSETGRYTKLKSVSYPDGSWEKYDYDGIGNRTMLMRPWKDQTLADAAEYGSLTTVYTYTADDGVTTQPFPKFISSIDEYVEYVQIKRTTISRTSTTVNGYTAVVESETVYPSASVGLTTKTTSYYTTAPPSLADRVVFVEYPDGRRDAYTYEMGNYTTNADPSMNQFTPNAGGTAERETVVHGTISAPGGIAFKTTKATSVRDQAGNVVLKEAYVYNGTGYERTAWTTSTYNERGQLTQTTQHDGQVTSATWAGDQQQAQTSATGIETTYTYDALNRVRTVTKKGVAASGGFPAQPDLVTTLTYDSEGRKLSEVAAGGSNSLTQAWVYDKAGRLQSETDQTGLIIAYTYANGGRTKTITLPGGATNITDHYLDGRPKSMSGTSTIPAYFDYGVNSDGTIFAQEFTGAGGLASPRWTKSTTDWLGRPLKAEKPSFTGANLIHAWSYNTVGQLQRERETFGIGAVKLQADKLYEYDELGNAARVGADVDDSGTLTAASTDRYLEITTAYEKSGSDWFLTMSRKYFYNNNDPTATTRTDKERLTNFPIVGTEKTVAESIAIDLGGNQVKTSTAIDQPSKTVTTKTDAPASNVDAVSISVNGLMQSLTPTTPQSATTYNYDGLGRITSITDPRSGTLTKSYHSTTGQLISTSDGVQTTGYEYYPATHLNAGRLKAQTNSVGKKTYYAYGSRGEIVQTWGDTTYPLEYIYDTYGQRTELHTFRSGSGWNAATWPTATTGAADVTRWLYHEPTGLLTEKQDAATKGKTYTYDILGRPQTSQWARTDAGGNRITTTYTYDAKTGDLTVINYSDATAQVRLGYDRVGRTATINDATGARMLAYNAAGEMQTTQNVGGILDGVALTVGFDGLLRRQSLQVSRNGTTLSSQTYSYDAASRLQTVASGSQAATYTYNPTRGLLDATTFTGGTAISRTYDAVGRLASITNTPAGGVAQSNTYTYNNLHQRTRATKEDGSYWAYQYNDRGELTFGKKYWVDNTPTAGQQQEYAYDNIGNRSTTLSGGDAAGASLRQATYTTNALNQYTQRTVPGAVDIIGSAAAGATVTVNGQATYRRAEYFQKTLALDNTVGPVYAQVDVVGAKTGAGANGEDAVVRQSGSVYLPKSAEAYTYDADGNLTSDGRWIYTWDAENRLTSMTALPNVPTAAKRRLEFTYDYAGRRVQKKVYGWNALLASYQLQTTRKFVYDGWNMLAELDGANALVRSYTWGQDVGGDMLGAGGIGGLLLVNEGGQSYQAGYDGSGNVTMLVKAGTNTVSASYEYDPFGKTVQQTGVYAASNPFRFSTKYTDAETELVNYGYRYYQPQTGRWLGRDPLEEEGGVNLYGFVDNNPVTRIDPLGLYEEDVHYYLTYFLARQAGCFDEDEARWVADGNQKTDEDDATAPAKGHGIEQAKSLFPLCQPCEDQRERHRKYHALTDPANHPGNIEELMKEARLPFPCRRDKRRENNAVREQKLRAFGRVLHYTQDTFSHMWYPDPWAGHGVEILRGRPHMPDKTHGRGDYPIFDLKHNITDWEGYDRVARAMDMVKDTWKRLKGWCLENECYDRSKDQEANFNRSLGKIMNFLRSNGANGNPDANPDSRVISPAELDFKRRLLTDGRGNPIPHR